MASLGYLWKHRAKFTIGSKEFYRAWGKRLLLLSELRQRNNRRNKLIAHGAVIHETAEIGNVIVEGNKSYLAIGAFSFIGRASIDLHCSVKIGEKVCINDSVLILSASHDVSDPKWSHVRGEIFIDDFAWIGTSAIILPGVRIGRGAVVGAGAVVSRSVGAGKIVVGNPAREISKSRGTYLDYNPCEFLAANRAWLIG